MDGGRRGVAVSDPTYMEVDGGGGRGGGNTFQLKENPALYTNNCIHVRLVSTMHIVFYKLTF